MMKNKIALQSQQRLHQRQATALLKMSGMQVKRLMPSDERMVFKQQIQSENYLLEYTFFATTATTNQLNLMGMLIALKSQSIAVAIETKTRLYQVFVKNATDVQNNKIPSYLKDIKHIREIMPDATEADTDLSDLTEQEIAMSKLLDGLMTDMTVNYQRNTEIFEFNDFYAKLSDYGVKMKRSQLIDELRKIKKYTLRVEIVNKATNEVIAQETIMPFKHLMIDNNQIFLLFDAKLCEQRLSMEQMLSVFAKSLLVEQTIQIDWQLNLYDIQDDKFTLTKFLDEQEFMDSVERWKNFIKFLQDRSVYFDKEKSKCECMHDFFSFFLSFISLTAITNMCLLNPHPSLKESLNQWHQSGLLNHDNNLL